MISTKKLSSSYTIINSVIAVSSIGGDEAGVSQILQAPAQARPPISSVEDLPLLSESLRSPALPAALVQKAIVETIEPAKTQSIVSDELASIRQQSIQSPMPAELSI